jgi:hypothetical protein
MEISIFLDISLDRTNSWSFFVNGNFKRKIIYTVLDLLFPGTAAKNATIGSLASNLTCDPAIPIMWLFKIFEHCWSTIWTYLKYLKLNRDISPKKGAICCFWYKAFVRIPLDWIIIEECCRWKLSSENLYTFIRPNQEQLRKYNYRSLAIKIQPAALWFLPWA